MATRSLPAAGRRSTPWQNGLGTTTEIVVWPPGATLAGFDWRLSIADVVTKSAFSNLPGIDRTLVPLTGAGIELTINGSSRPVAAFEAIEFDGGDDVVGAPISGPIRDLNLMLRRDAAVGSLEIVTDPHRLVATIGTDGWTVAIVLQGSVITGRGETLAEGDGILLTSGEAGEAEVELEIGDGILAIAHILPRNPVGSRYGR
jgi:environmental stress-induced protein Ves